MTPRLGFLGVGWIGRNRMEAIARSGVATIAAVADEAPAAAQGAAPSGSRVLATLDDLLELDLDGVVIATPSAQHAEQSLRALEHGLAVFCQRPLGRTGEETDRVVQAARAADRLLGVDLSYRHVEGVRKVRELVRSGELGTVYAVDLVFHNACGPDKSWFHDTAGGGCLVDLGIHLVDLALWTLDGPGIERTSARLLAGGRRAAATEREDFCEAQLVLASGAVARVACSWRLPAGRDCVIEASFYGTRGGASIRNVNGSFHDFRTELYRGTQRSVLAQPPDDWGGRAAVAWAEQLARSRRYDPAVESITRVARALDWIYAA